MNRMKRATKTQRRSGPFRLLVEHVEERNSPTSLDLSQGITLLPGSDPDRSFDAVDRQKRDKPAVRWFSVHNPDQTASERDTDAGGGATRTAGESQAQVSVMPG